VILYGTGPFLRKVYETALAAGEVLTAYFTEPLEETPPLPIPSIGPYNPEVHPDEAIFLSFLDGTIRRNLSRRLRHPLAGPLIHPSAQVENAVKIGAGTFVGPGVQIGAEATIGPLVIIEEGARIEAGARIAEGAYIGPYAQIEAGVQIGPYVYVGAGAILAPMAPAQPLLIGEGSLIGPRARIQSPCLPFCCVPPAKVW